MKGIKTTYVAAGALVALGLVGGSLARSDIFHPAPRSAAMSATPCWRLLAEYDTSLEAARNFALNVRRAEAAGRDAREARADQARALQAITALRKAAAKAGCDVPDHEFEATSPIGAVTVRDVIAVRSF